MCKLIYGSIYLLGKRMNVINKYMIKVHIWLMIDLMQEYTDLRWIRFIDKYISEEMDNSLDRLFN